jgi:hypothetical protein
MVETCIIDAALIPGPSVAALIRSPLISSPLIAPLVIVAPTTAIAWPAIAAVVVALAVLLPARLARVRGRHARSDTGSGSESRKAQHRGDRGLGRILFHVHG